MENKKEQPIKKTWQKPELLVLNVKNTGDGFIESNFEDSRYTNVIS